MPGARVVHLCATLGIGGLEQVVLDLVHAARAQGHDDRVVTFDPLDGGEPENPRATGVPVIRLLRRSALDRACVIAIADALRHAGARVLHAHNGTALVLAALAIRRLPRTARPRLVVTWHNLPAHPSRAGRWFARWAARHASATVAVAGELRARLIAGGWLRDAEVIVNGVDAGRFTPRSHSRSDRSLRVGMLARLAPPKRPDLLLAAARLLADRGHALELVFAGDGPLRAHLMERAGDLESVRWLGFVADPRPFFGELDVFALLSDHEGTPLAMLEAMASGLPVVASAVGGIPALVGPDDGVILVRNEPAELADALGGLAAAARREALAAQARRTAASRLALSRSVERYEALYVRGD